MIVCKQCLQAIESHEGKQKMRPLRDIKNAPVIHGDFDNDGNFIQDDFGYTLVAFCEWCEQYEIAEDMCEI